MSFTTNNSFLYIPIILLLLFLLLPLSIPARPDSLVQQLSSSVRTVLQLLTLVVRAGVGRSSF